jgi:hypothetical protein
MRTLAAVLLLLGSLAALALVPGAAASPCTTSDSCVGVCLLRSAQCDNDGDSGNLVCAFDGVPAASVCVPYFDCPPKFGCHPSYGIGYELYCDLTTSSCLSFA